MESENSVPNTEIKPIDVYNVLESRKFVDKIFNGILYDIKNSSAYIDLKEIAIQHFASIEAGKNHEPIESKKKQTRDVGNLSDCIASTLTKTVHEKLLALQDEIYATSETVIEELEKKTSDNRDRRYPETSLSKQNGSHSIYSSTPNKRSGKRCLESNSVSEKYKFLRYGHKNNTSEEDNNTHLTADVQSKSTVQSNFKSKRVVLPIADKVEILKELDSGISVNILAKQYNIGSRTIYDMKRQKEEIRKCYSECPEGTIIKKFVQKRMSLAFDKALIEWFKHCRKNGVFVSNHMWIKKANLLHSHFKLKKVRRYGNRWLRRFKDQNRILLSSTEKHVPDHIGVTNYEDNMNKRKCDEKDDGKISKPKESIVECELHVSDKTPLKNSEVGSHLTADVQSKSVVQSNVKNHRVTLPIAKKIEILKKLDDGISANILAKEYNIGNTTIYDMKRQKEEIRKCYSEFPEGMIFRKSLQKRTSLVLDKALIDWFQRCTENGIVVSKRMWMKQAKLLHSQLNLKTKHKYDNKWLRRFKDQNRTFFNHAKKFVPEHTGLTVKHENNIEIRKYDERCNRKISKPKESLIECKIPVSDTTSLNELEIGSQVTADVQSQTRVQSNVKSKCVSLPISDKIEILKKLDDGISVNILAKEYNIANRTIYDMKKQKEGLRKYYSEFPEGMIVRKSIQKSTSPALHKALIEWFNQCSKNGTFVSNQMWMKQAELLHSQLKLKTENKYDSQWLHRFKNQNRIFFHPDEKFVQAHTGLTEKHENYIEIRKYDKRGDRKISKPKESLIECEIPVSDKTSLKELKVGPHLTANVQSQTRVQSNVKIKYVTTPIADKIEILKKLDDGISVKALSKEYAIKIHSIYNMIKQKEELRKYYSEYPEGMIAKKAMQKRTNPAFDKCLIEWYKQCSKNNIFVSRHMWIKQAKLLHSQLKLKTVDKYNDKWLFSFRRQNKILLNSTQKHVPEHVELTVKRDNDNKVKTFEETSDAKNSKLKESLMECEVRLVDIMSLINSKEDKNNIVSNITQTIIDGRKMKGGHQALSVESLCENSEVKSSISGLKSQKANTVVYSPNGAVESEIPKNTTERTMISFNDTVHKKDFVECKNNRDIITSRECVTKLTDRKTGKRKHKVLSISEKLEILKKIDEGITTKTLCEQYDVGSSTIYDMKRQRATARKCFSKHTNRMKIKESVFKSSNHTVDKALIEWCKECSREGISISGAMLIKQAKLLHTQLKLKTYCKYTKVKWLPHFKNQYRKILCEIPALEKLFFKKSEECKNNLVPEGTSIDDSKTKWEPQIISVESISEKLEVSTSDLNAANIEKGPSPIGLVNSEVLENAKKKTVPSKSTEDCDQSKNSHEINTLHKCVNSKLTNKDPAKHKRGVLSASDKLEILKQIDMGISVKNLSRQYGAGLSTIYDMKQRRVEAKKYWGKDSKKMPKESAITTSNHSVDKSLIAWFQQCSRVGISVSGAMLMKQAKIFHSELNLETDCNYNKRWLHSFENQYCEILYS